MATTPTNNPIPSESPKDLKFNAGKIDEIVNSEQDAFSDRFNKARLTWAGIEKISMEAITAYGYITIDSFEDGATITLPNQALKYESDGNYYRWDGSLPKVVPPNSTPQSSGGIGVGSWLSIGAAGLASSQDGAGDALIAVKQPYAGSTTITQHDQNKTYVSVLNFGAKGDGVTDDTTAFQAAFDSGCLLIRIPSTNYSYRLTSTLVVKNSITIIGDGVEPYTANGSPSTRGPGSWLYFDHTDVGVRLDTADKSGKRFYRLGTYRNQTAPTGTNSFVPTVCGYDFYVNDSSGFLFEDVCILNAYRGFYVTGGTRGYFNRVSGQPLLEGIRINESYDCIRVENIHFWPFWASNETVWQWTLDNGRALIVNRSDGLIINNFFCIFYSYGFIFTGNSTPGDTSTKVLMSNIFLDEVKYGYYVDESASYHSANVSNFNSQIRSTVYSSQSQHINIRGTYVDVNFVGCNLASAGGSAVYVKDIGCQIGLHNLSMNRWNMGASSNNNPAIVVENLNSSVVVSGKSNISRKAGDLSSLVGGLGRLKMPLTDGTANANTDGGGLVVVTHGMNVQPRFVDIQIFSDIGLMWSITNISATTFTVKFRTSSSSTYNSSGVQFSWQVSL